LKGISYNLKTPDNFQTYKTLGALTEKEQADIAALQEVQEKLKTDKRTRLGFIAQDVQAIFPELVEEDAEGYLSVDYLGLIPVLVEAIKEQQVQIEELQKKAIKDGFIPGGN
jgi:DNA-binding MltR family transcriptional regulator